MPGRVHTYQIVTTADVPETGANTETVAATLSTVQTEFPNQQILIQGYVTINSPAGTTAQTLRVRRNGLAGTLISEANVEQGDVAASKESTIPVWAADSPGDVAGATYVVTFQGTGEGGPSTCVGSLLQATVS